MSVRTKLVFLDLPYHCEYSVGLFPLIQEGFVIEFERFEIPDRVNPGKVRVIDGPQIVERLRNTYSPKDGLTQYLELRHQKVLM